MEELLNTATRRICSVILGKEQSIRLALSCFFARGNLLLEDLPGVGKTTLAQVLAKTIGLNASRIQFTSDLLPADILGTSILNSTNGLLAFSSGPIFNNIVLADEINRASPRCQSALLEAMEEYQVSIEGKTRPLPQPFFVIATQNPQEQVGTYPLPESQLDRFHMRISLGYPDEKAERELLKGKDRRRLIDDIEPCLSVEQILSIQAAVEDIHVSDALLDYLQRILKFSRESGNYETGLSPRAGIALRQCAQAWALMAGRDHVLPEDVQVVLPHVVEHRLRPASNNTENSYSRATPLSAQLNCIAIP